MRFESRENRLMWFGAAISLLIDLGISIAIVYAFAEIGLVMVLIAVVGIQLLKVLVWARGLIGDWLVFRLYGRKYMIDMFLDGLTKIEFPKPDDYQTSSTNYFNDVVENDSLDCQKRIEASYFIAFLQYPTSVGRYWEGVRHEIVMERAIEKYKERFI